MFPTPEVHSLFRRATMFDLLSDDEVDAFALFLRERRLAPGALLFQQGEPGGSLFVLLDGEVAVFLRAPNGEHLRVGQLHPGDVIGEQSCLDPAPRSATVTAVTAALALELTRDELDRMARELPRVASLLLGVIIQELTDRLRAVDRRIDAELGVGAPPRATPPPPSTRPSTWQRLAERFRGAQ
jgi:CRP/FNR family cyclic AMP-dependent transcriptional regulator